MGRAKAMLDDGSTTQGYFNPQTQEIVLSSQLTPNQINNPIAVTKSRTRRNGYVVLTELNENVDGVKKPVIAALHLNKTNNGLEVVNISRRLL